MSDVKEGKLYDGLGEFGIQFSPDSQRVAYMGARGTKRVVVLRAPSSQPAPPAGERGARASRSTIEERESEPYENVGDKGVSFSADSRHYAFTAQLDGKWFVAVDGVA